ncbi:MAG: site-specific DNA-methyltransferase [Candidatus Eisenbacteria bacterium]|nr:site-specific DNA-methyltransferase [Candidatus Eisenbacteria bacterium]
MAKKPTKSTYAPKKVVETLLHDEATRKNIPTAEYQSVVKDEQQSPLRVAYERRNRDLDPQLVWRGKDEQDWSDLVVNAPPLYIQEKVHPKVLIDDLLRKSQADAKAADPQIDLFSDFNGIPAGADKTEFYQHDQNWSNRMILGDSLQVMASLAEREGVRGKVQCIYFDPPYGIKFNSNFQWSTTSRDVKDGNAAHITREPEQVKAFRDTWRDGIHSYLTYLRDRLSVARDLLADSGSVFVQIGDENVHRVRLAMEEVFGERNFVSLISFAKTTSFSGSYLSSINDYIVWFCKNADSLKFRACLRSKELGDEGATRYKPIASFGSASSHPFQPDRLVWMDNTTSQGESREQSPAVAFEGESWAVGAGLHWKTTPAGMERLIKAGRIASARTTLNYLRFLEDYPAFPISNIWLDIGGIKSRSDPKIYVVQTSTSAVQRCILMATDPGDLVLDPTCGSGTTAMVAEQWGRRWITIDTSRVALALARARVMGARYPFYLLADSRDGQLKEAEVTRTAASSQPVQGSIRHGFVYERVPHITLKSIANNAEIDVIWEQWQTKLEPLREKLNAALKQSWQEWEIPREVEEKWSEAAKALHGEWWQARIARQQEIDKSIAAKAEYEFLYDKPYVDSKKVRVAGPFTVESLSPHRVLAVDEDDQLVGLGANAKADVERARSFTEMVLENLRVAGVQQASKEDRISFTALTPWPGKMLCAEGRFLEGEDGKGVEKRAAIFVGSEFGTVQRADLVAAAREAGDARFDVLIACAFNYEAHTTEFGSLGRVRVLKARMNADLHMSEDLKNTGKGNLFVVFGEPDIDILPESDGRVRVKVNGVDVFHPSTGEVRSDGADGIACWFIDTDYNEESFFVRHAYFLGANDPYSSLKTTLKAEINEEAWGTLHSDTSRPFEKPKSGRIAVKVINHLGDEVMKVFRA